MKKQVLRLVAKNFVDWLGTQLPPSGHPPLHDLEARFLVLIDALPDGGGPDLGDVERLDADGVRMALEWLFTSVAAANAGDSWVALASHLLRVMALRGLGEITHTILSEPKLLDHGPHPSSSPLTGGT